MYIADKNKVFYTAVMDRGIIKFTRAVGTVIPLFGVGAIFSVMCSVCLRTISTGTLPTEEEVQPLMLLSFLAAFLCTAMGLSFLSAANAMEQVRLTIYDGGITGTSAQLITIDTFYNKTALFDIPFSKITCLRIENGVLCIKSQNEIHRFQFSSKEQKKLYQLIADCCDRTEDSIALSAPTA